MGRIGMYQSKTTSLGLSLVEIMVALILGLLILHFIGLFLVNIFTTEQHKKMIHDIQENATKAIGILKSEISKAGYIGCMRLSNHFPLLNNGNHSLNLYNRLSGSRNTITVSYVNFTGTILLTPMRDRHTLIVSKTGLSNRDIFVIADCLHAEIFQVKQIVRAGNKLILRTDKSLQNSYHPYAEIGTLVKNEFFTAKTKRTRNGRPIYALFMRDIHHRKTELVEQIEQLNLQYMINQAGLLKEEEGDHVADWRKVLGVSIKLIFNHQNNKHIWYAFQSLPFSPG